MIWLLFLLGSLNKSEASNLTEVFSGLGFGLLQDGEPGACSKYFPNVLTSYRLYQESLASKELYTVLHGFQNVTNTLTTFVGTCNFQGLADQMFTIYKWTTLQPILVTLASNLTLFMQIINDLLFSIHNGFYYNIGQYAGNLISLVFGFYI